MSLTVRVLLGLFAGLAAGLAISAADVPWLRALTVAVEPVGTLWVNAIRMTVIPLVVASLIVAVASARDPRTIGRLGSRALAFFVIALIAAGLVTVVLAPALLSRLTIDPAAAAAVRAAAGIDVAESVQRLPTFTQWVVELVPANPFRAAADGAILPLIVFAIALGLALTRIAAERREPLTRFFAAVADAMLVLVRWVLVLAPIGVFALALPLAMRMGLAAAGALAYYNGVVVVVCLAFMAVVLYPAAVLLGRVQLRRFVQAATPAQAVAFSSRSSMASLPLMMEGAGDVLRVPTQLASFFLPLAASVFRVGSVIALTIGAMFIGRLYDVPVGPAQLVAIVVTSILTSFSVPAVPGGTILVGVPVLMAAGLPVEGIGILLAIDTIPDMFRTTANVTAHMTGVAILARGAEAPVPALAAAES